MKKLNQKVKKHFNWGVFWIVIAVTSFALSVLLLLNKLPLKTRDFNPVMKTALFIAFFLKSIFPSFPLL